VKEKLEPVAPALQMPGVQHRKAQGMSTVSLVTIVFPVASMKKSESAHAAFLM